MFIALETAYEVLDLLAPLEARIRQRRKSLADQIYRASESIVLNLAEGRARKGLDRIDLFGRAAGSAQELGAALRLARSRGFITADEFATIDKPLDKVRAMTWSLSH